jgi:hypothetical protein
LSAPKATQKFAQNGSLWPILTQSKGIRPVKVRFHTAKTRCCRRRSKLSALRDGRTGHDRRD